MAPHPHLHPRSNLTTGLFGTTLLVSFAVVGLPHILPCPRPRVVYSDSEGGDLSERPWRDSGGGHDEKGDGENKHREMAAEMSKLRAERQERERKARECPVPKPSGRLGEWLGFKSSSWDGQSEGKREKP